MDETADETAATAGHETANPPGATIAVSVDEAAAHFGISPQAVRKRIAAGHLEAHRAGRAWRVFIAPQPIATDAGEGFRETSKPSSTKPVAQSQRDQFALMVEPIIAPWVAKVEELSREAERNRLRADTADHLAAALKDERDSLQAEIEQLRRSFEAVRGASAPDRGQEAPGGAEAVPMAPDAPRPRPASWLRRLFGRGSS